MLGIVIGVATVICVVAICDGALSSVERAITNIGANMIWVEAGGVNRGGVRTGSGATKTLTLGDYEATALGGIPGVRIVVTDRDRFSAGRTGAAVLWAVHRAAPESLVVRGAVFDDRFGRPAMREAIIRGEDPDQVVTRDSAAVSAWWRSVARYRLYR